MEIETLIIGAGIAGVSLAEYLSRGVSDIKSEVLVVERDDESGEEATAHSAARARTSMWTNPTDVLMAKYSIALFREMGLFKAIGYGWLAKTEKELDAMKKDIELQKSLGVADSVILNKEEIKKKNPFIDTSKVVGLFLSKGDGKVGPDEITRGLYNKAKENGAGFLFNSEVEQVDVRDGEVRRVTLSNGEYIKAGKIVVATGAYSKDLGKNFYIDGKQTDIKVPITPVKRQLTFFRPPREYLGDVRKPHSFMIYEGMYWDVEENEEIMCGFAKPDDPECVDLEPVYEQEYFDEYIAPRIEEIVPELLEGAKDFRGIAGLYAISDDRDALICEHPAIKGLYFITGFSGHGIMQSPAAAKLLGNLILGLPQTLEGHKLDMSKFQYKQVKHGKRMENL